jgi:hypothetical protein
MPVAARTHCVELSDTKENDALGNHPVRVSDTKENQVVHRNQGQLK